MYGIDKGDINFKKLIEMQSRQVEVRISPEKGHKLKQANVKRLKRNNSQKHK